MKKNLLLEYDESVDAAYITVTEAEWDHQVRLDDARGIDYAADGSVIGIEILSPRRKGVSLDAHFADFATLVGRRVPVNVAIGLPFKDDLARLMQAVSFRILEGAR